MAKAKAELHVVGLAQPGRVRIVEESLSAIAGVEYAHVNLGKARVTVEYDDSVTSVESLMAALKRAGFDAHQT